jgi:hypothetical protein
MFSVTGLEGNVNLVALDSTTCRDEPEALGQCVVALVTPGFECRDLVAASHVGTSCTGNTSHPLMTRAGLGPTAAAELSQAVVIGSNLSTSGVTWRQT